MSKLMSGILYGVAGEGSGHATRAREIIRHLERAGHAVEVVSYETGYENLHSEFHVAEITGLHLAYRRNAVQYLPTLLENVQKIPGLARSFERVRTLANRFNPDLVISDFEPVSGIIARLRRIPLISIDNQHELTRTRAPYPKQYERDALTAKAIITAVLPRATAYIVTSFRNPTPTRARTAVVPPILRNDILGAKPTRGPDILVYVTSPYVELLKILHNVQATFIIYGLPRRGQFNNCRCAPPSRGDFLRDLISCRAVIANAGFSLITEALHLGKPYLAIPVRGQFEQIFNAHALASLGYGEHVDALTRENVEQFLYNTERYANALRGYPRQDNATTFRVIDDLITTHMSA
ncbi:MAG: MJ1255/VC2487 family glycosyltransferase [Candidatus Uhrbacteria bacterium]